MFRLEALSIHCEKPEAIRLDNGKIKAYKISYEDHGAAAEEITHTVRCWTNRVKSIIGLDIIASATSMRKVDCSLRPKRLPSASSPFAMQWLRRGVPNNGHNIETPLQLGRAGKGISFSTNDHPGLPDDLTIFSSSGRYQRKSIKQRRFRLGRSLSIPRCKFIIVVVIIIVFVIAPLIVVFVFWFVPIN